MKRKFEFEPPSLMTILIVFVLGLSFPSFLQQVNAVLLFDVLGSVFILSFPFIAVFFDPTNRKAMHETQNLVCGLEQPFLTEKPRPCSAKDLGC